MQVRALKHRSELLRRAGILSAAFVLATIAAATAGAATKQDIDAHSYKLGSINSWSEAVGAGVKELALSSPADPAEMDELAASAEEIAAEHGVSVYRETDFLVTDLFPASVTDGKQVLLIYKGQTLDKYFALKRQKQDLVAAGAYTGDAREGIAREFGRLLSYPEATIDVRLNKPGAVAMRSPSDEKRFSGVWKAPTVSLDDPRWHIEDVACINGCSLIAYNYFHELLVDPENDDKSVVDLYEDVNAFNEKYIALLTTNRTHEQRAGYDAAYDAALDCNPDGDGLQHEITAPPPTEIEERDDAVIIRYEYWNAVRTVHLDGASPPSDLKPTRLGYSVGRYDGQALVVETSGLEPSQIRIGARNYGKFFLSEDARFVERYTVSEDGNRLEIDWSVTDPLNLRQPYVGKVTLLSAPDWELDEFVCEAITGEF